jgi:hypothetical protein
MIPRPSKSLKTPTHLVRIIPLGRRTQARDLVLLGAQDPDIGPARRECRVGLVEPHVGEGHEAGERAAVVGPLDDPVCVFAREGGAVGEGDGVGVGLGEVGEGAVVGRKRAGG